MIFYLSALLRRAHLTLTVDPATERVTRPPRPARSRGSLFFSAAYTCLGDLSFMYRQGESACGTLTGRLTAHEQTHTVQYVT